MSESKVIKKKKSGKKNTAMKMPEETKQAQSATAEIGKISDTITGTGNLTLADVQSQTVPSRIEIEEVLKRYSGPG